LFALFVAVGDRPVKTPPLFTYTAFLEKLDMSGIASRKRLLSTRLKRTVEKNHNTLPPPLTHTHTHTPLKHACRKPSDRFSSGFFFFFCCFKTAKNLYFVWTPEAAAEQSYDL